MVHMLGASLTTTTPTPEERTPDYQWVEYMPKLWNETRLVFLINNTYFSFVIARILYDNGDKIPSAGKIFSRNRTIVFNHEKNTSDHKLEGTLKLFDNDELMYVNVLKGPSN
ncbi:hypothetical protein PV325_012460 [Microctonus aethiopoides]|nr:hypothetical protein PV325_012460 [Microctonus aethiopoides]